MLTEAHHWRAQSRYTERMAEVIRSSCNSTLTGACAAWSTPNLHVDPQQTCDFALSLNLTTADPVSSAPLLAARSSCQALERQRNDARFQIVRALELLGAPYSYGDDAGDGARLVLGTDFTLGQDKRDALKGKGLDVAETISTWLVPASPRAFDKACSAALFPDPDGRSNCTLFGKHGDGGESWSGLGSPLGYAASLWEPAGFDTWFTLRYGMNVSSSYNGGAVGSGPAGNLLLALESTLEGAYQVPMSGLSNRTWWISGYKIPKLYLTDFDLRDPKGDNGVFPVLGDYGNKAVEVERYWIRDNVYIQKTLAFTAVNASDRTAGPAGIVFARSDFRSAFSAVCERLEVKGTDSQNHDLRFSCSASKVSASFHAPFFEGGPFATSCITRFRHSSPTPLALFLHHVLHPSHFFSTLSSTPRTVSPPFLSSTPSHSFPPCPALLATPPPPPTGPPIQLFLTETNAPPYPCFIPNRTSPRPAQSSRWSGSGTRFPTRKHATKR